MQDSQEYKLIQEMKQGDIPAFEALLRLYEKPIYNHLRRIVGIDDASDCAQETFMKLYTHRTAIDPKSRLKNWLYKVATNTAYDLLRKKKRLFETALSPEDENICETNLPEAAYSTMEQEILVQDIEAALLKIPVHYRSILLLYYREGFSYEELADLLSMPLNTVKTHLRRSKEALKQTMKSYG
jgi:RNA polymerase sigma-70 factor (ECF subfamily)